MPRSGAAASRDIATAHARRHATVKRPTIRPATTAAKSSEWTGGRLAQPRGLRQLANLFNMSREGRHCLYCVTQTGDRYQFFYNMLTCGGAFHRMQHPTLGCPKVALPPLTALRGLYCTVAQGQVALAKPAASGELRYLPAAKQAEHGVAPSAQPGIQKARPRRVLEHPGVQPVERI